ncbi:hypothetical protein SAMN05421505_11299 [Sinosporangium album]|uniref:Uncharacterized protein n=1 Tax=Sinosporangium album TaxID=504805 RepID=A0A1G8ACG3_9ACTN|nr:hypothetical protein [Sinosporangium album]SDH18553.1 hypothetical protein SAMN05421505_11299 [Sinosporangium album]
MRRERVYLPKEPREVRKGDVIRRGEKRQTVIDIEIFRPGEPVPKNYDRCRHGTEMTRYALFTIKGIRWAVEGKRVRVFIKEDAKEEATSVAKRNNDG